MQRRALPSTSSWNANALLHVSDLPLADDERIRVAAVQLADDAGRGARRQGGAEAVLPGLLVPDSADDPRGRADDDDLPATDSSGPTGEISIHHLCHHPLVGSLLTFLSKRDNYTTKKKTELLSGIVS